MNTFKKGDLVKLKSEFSEPGEARYIYRVLEDEYPRPGQMLTVEIQPINFEFALPPIERVSVLHIRKFKEI